MSGSVSGNIVGRTLGDRIILGLVIALALVMVAPVVWVVALSVKDNKELMLDMNSVFRAPYTIKNYIDVIGTSSVFRWVLNSTIVSGGLTLATLVLSSLAGYGFARLNFPYRNVLFVIVLLGLAVPEQAVLIARQQIFGWLKLHNTYPGLDPAGAFRTLRRLPDDAVFSRHPQGAGRGGPARQRQPLQDLLEGALAAHHSGAGNAWHLHLLQRLE